MEKVYEHNIQNGKSFMKHTFTFFSYILKPLYELKLAYRLVTSDHDPSETSPSKKIISQKPKNGQKHKNKWYVTYKTNMRNCWNADKGKKQSGIKGRGNTTYRRGEPTTR